MKTAAECRALAAQCREVAKGMSEQHREQTLEMADAWEVLATQREPTVPKSWLREAMRARNTQGTDKLG